MDFCEFYSAEWLKNRFDERVVKSSVAGLDGISPRRFAQDIDLEVELIRKKVLSLDYKFSKFKEKLILKNKHSLPRAVYIPTVRDRLTLNALNAFLQQEFKDNLILHGVTAKEIISNLIDELRSSRFDAFVKVDVRNFFPSLDHAILRSKIEEIVNDKAAISLIRKVLNRSRFGVSQGLSVSSIMASIYMNELDNEFIKSDNWAYFRYVDDIIILCASDDISRIDALINQRMNALKLDIHPHGGESRKSESGLLSTTTLSYLGYVLSGERISVREKSIEMLRNRLTKVVAAATVNQPIQDEDFYEELYKKINLKITGCLYNGKPYGWLFYFNKIDDLTLLHHLDWFVKSLLDRYGLEYDPQRVKSFVKAYFKMRGLKVENLDSQSYIPAYNSESKTVPLDLGFLSEDDEDNESSRSETPDLKALLHSLRADVEIYG